MTTRAADFWDLFLSPGCTLGRWASPESVRCSLETLDGLGVDARSVAVSMRWLTWAHTADEIDHPQPGKWKFISREQVRNK